MRKYQRQNATTITYNKILQNIIEMVYKPGEHLSEHSLSAELSISRTTLRQALHRLEMEHLLIKKSNGRIYVAPVSIKDAEEIYHIREVLEGLIAKEATRNITEKALKKLEYTLELMNFATIHNEHDKVIYHGFEFHYILYHMSQNKTAINFLEQIKNRIERYRHIGELKHTRYLQHEPIQEHEKIFNLIKLGNEIAVEEEMKSHIRRSLISTIESIHFYFNEKEN